MMDPRVTALSSVLPRHQTPLDETCDFLGRFVPDRLRERLERTLREGGNRTRHTIRPLPELARLRGTAERLALHRVEAEHLAFRAVALLADAGILHAPRVTTIIFVSSTGWAAPSLDTHLMRRLGVNPHCRRIPLNQLGCAGGAAALALASELADRDPRQRVLVVSAETPSVHLQLGDASYAELVTAGQFADGAGAAIVSCDAEGPSVLATHSTLMPEVDEGGRIIAGETGFRLLASAGLPALIESRVRDLIQSLRSQTASRPSEWAFVAAHPRGRAVLDAVKAGLDVDATLLEPSYAAWRDTGNMISASLFRVLQNASRAVPVGPRAMAPVVAFGTGLAAESLLLHWTSVPTVVSDPPQ